MIARRGSAAPARAILAMHPWWTGLTLLALLAPARLPAQTATPGVFLPTADAPADAEEDKRDARKLSYAEVHRLLLDRGLSEEAARRILRDYPVDRTFTDAELQEIFRRVRPEDLRTRGEAEKRAPEEESPEVIPQTGTGVEALKPFGYEVFARAPESFDPDQDLAVGPDYRLGPGDELKVTIWGSVEQEYFTVVDREGRAVFPEIGPVAAAGMTLGDFETQLRRDFGKTFSGFRMAVSLGRLRRIQVVVAGDVQRPGAYLLSPVSNAFNAVYYAGGPTEEGTLRRVRIVRDGRIVAEVDLYRYLLEGDTSDETRLLSGDTVFLLHKGPQASLRGEVRRPAIYELKGGETVADLVRMGGGFTATAYTTRATLDRVGPATGPVSVELDLTPLLAAPDSTGRPAPPPSDAPDQSTLALQDGDDLTVYSLYHVEPREFVELQGMVQYPGIYPLFPGMRVSHLAFRGGGLLESAFRARAELSRLAGPAEGLGEADSVSRVTYVDLARALAEPGGEADVVLQRNDKLYVRRIPGWKLQETVKVSGEVVFPGIYPLVVKEERLSRVMRRAGGLTPEAFPRGASLFRKEQGRVIINFEKVLHREGEREDIALVDGDSIHVPAYPPTILVEGEVSRPGALLFEPGKNADYYVDRTGGVNEQGSRGGTRIVKVDGVVQKAFRRFWWDPNVQPGSRIVVAARPAGHDINWGGVIRDTTAILASLATTVFIITQIDKSN